MKHHQEVTAHQTKSPSRYQPSELVNYSSLTFTKLTKRVLRAKVSL